MILSIPVVTKYVIKNSRAKDIILLIERLINKKLKQATLNKGNIAETKANSKSVVNPLKGYSIAYAMFNSIAITLITTKLLLL